jgi:hypothetical protein
VKGRGQATHHSLPYGPIKSPVPPLRLLLTHFSPPLLLRLFSCPCLLLKANSSTWVTAQSDFFTSETTFHAFRAYILTINSTLPSTHFHFFSLIPICKHITSTRVSTMFTRYVFLALATFLPLAAAHGSLDGTLSSSASYLHSAN